MPKVEYCTVNFNLNEGSVRANYLRADGNHLHVDLLNGEPVAFEELDNTRYQIVAQLGDEGWQLASIFNATLYYFVRQVGHAAIEEESVEQSGIQLDRERHRARIEGKEIPLTETESKLMAALMEKPNEPISPASLLQTVFAYPPNTGDPVLVRAHIRNLKAKVEKGREKEVIKSVPGVGYMVVM